MGKYAVEFLHKDKLSRRIHPNFNFLKEDIYLTIVCISDIDYIMGKI